MEIWCKVKSSDAPLSWEREIEKTHTRNVKQVYRAIFLQSRTRKWMHVCVWYVGGTKPTNITVNGILLYIRSVFGRWCTNPRRPGDPVTGT